MSPIPDPPNKRRKGNPDKDDEGPLPSWDIPWDPDTSGYYKRVNSYYELYSPFAHAPNTIPDSETEETEENPGFRNLRGKWEYRGHWPSTRKTLVSPVPLHTLPNAYKLIVILDSFTTVKAWRTRGPALPALSAFCMSPHMGSRQRRCNERYT